MPFEISTTMASVAPVKHAAVNPCCLVWKEKYSKVEEGRKCLRQAVKLLREQADKFQAENVGLKKVCDEERARTETEKELREKELAHRHSLETEISALKTEIFSLQQKGNTADSEGLEGEIKTLQGRLLKGEKEIIHLKELLEKEKLRVHSEKKNAADALEHVKAEKSKVDKERKLAIAEGKKAEKYRLQLEALKKAVDEGKSKLVSANLKTEEVADIKLEAGGSVESEAAKADVKWELAETIERKFFEERSRAGNLSRQLENANKKAEQCCQQLQVLKQEAEETKSSLVCATLKFEEVKKELIVEKSNVTKERKRANLELAKAEEQWKLAEANKNKFLEERSRATKISLLLEAAENRIRELEKEIKKLKIEGPTKLVEAERQKAMTEKRRADSEMFKAEEERKLADLNKKMAEKEKSRAQHLSHQLKEDRLKIEELQKQSQELFSFRKLVETSALFTDRDMNGRTTDVKLLEKQLKLEKKRLKHAKEVAKFEKSRNNILQQELHRLKLDFLQFSCRLGALDRCFSSCNEGTGGTKQRLNFSDAWLPHGSFVGGFMDLQLSNLKNKLYGMEPCQMDLKTEGERLRSCGTGFAASDPVRHHLDHTAPMFTVSGGHYPESVSGIDSELGSLLGGSNQKMLHSSAINSSSASFSDGQLVGSQGRGAFVTTSENLAEENLNAQPTLPSICGEVTEMPQTENQDVVAENNVKDPVKVDVTGMVNGNSGKRRMLNEIEDIESFGLEGKKLHLQKMEDKLSVCVINRQVDMLLDEQKCVGSNIQGAMHSISERFHKKRKVNCEENVMRQQLTDSDELAKLENIENAFPTGMNASNSLSPYSDCLLPESPLEGTEVSLCSGLDDMTCFEEVANGDYMKLLELDDAADEELYRRALAMPMSPDLPEIESATAETFNLDEDKFPSSYTTVSAKASDILDSVLEIDMPNMPNCRDGGLMFGVESELGSVQEKSPLYCVSLSSLSDLNISRVFSATRCLMTHCSLGAHAKGMVQDIMHALKMEKELSRREKACTFFTSLLLNFSACTWGTLGTFMDEDFVFCVGSFRQDINAALVSDTEVKPSFAEECCLDEFLNVALEFLRDGRVYVQTDVSCDSMLEPGSVTTVLLDDKTTNLSLKFASGELLMAGSIILGSICAAIDRLEFLCEASYNLLRIRRHDTATILTLLHIFAYLGGESFLTLKDYSLTMTVLKSVVMFLEDRSSSAAAASSHIPSSNTVMSVFRPCAKCLFSWDAVPIAVVTSMLLEKLQTFIVPGPMQSTNLSSFSVLRYKDKAYRHLSDEEGHSDVGRNHDTCCLSKCKLPASDSNAVMNETLSDLSDILSLVELLACNLSWDWTSGKIIPVLLGMLERANSQKLVIAVIILLGQLGRIGVAACGYEDGGVDTLSHKLCGYLTGEFAAKSGFPVQIATVSALLGLSSLDFRKVVSSNLELLTTGRLSEFSDRLRNWFSLLSKEQQVLSFALLQPAGTE
ncbi:hypothetical protein Tsubulata_005283 [Turnera subulata]|uniref:Maternal effect embryo arrest 22 n=1 Tax=Turnera subulata TaxID=218843 RepID=A0A9Q0J949_9ROSI|nr:hypothetical protein Tsubulata_005283 [Turnera subulata]